VLCVLVVVADNQIFLWWVYEFVGYVFLFIWRIRRIRINLSVFDVVYHKAA